MKRTLLFLLSLLFTLSAMAQLPQLPQPKREFRGAWIQIVNGQFQGMSSEALQAELTRQLNVLQRCHVNTVIFQVRAEGDAFYHSPYEPWSRFLTGQQGQPPLPLWDPLEWMVEQCHRRGMELHAWINPYRAKTKGTTQLSSKHPFMKDANRFIQYGDLLLFDPGLSENREYICNIVEDIVNRYDIDGIHIDDYFYPYPQPGMEFDDIKTFRTRSNGFTDINDWRRDNVNRLIQALYVTIHRTKPWVKFGVSPFGIYHNATPGSSIPGSKTNGLQDYDDLYADVLLWVNKGWVDYIVPQVYWEIGNKVADYETLVKWWGKYGAGRTLVIGQDIPRTVKTPDLKNPRFNQLPEKFYLQRTTPGVKGACLWYSTALKDNVGNSASAMQHLLQPYPALQPRMPYIDNKAPKKVRSLSTHTAPNGLYLFWREPRGKKVMDKADKYVVYCFAENEKIDLNNPTKIVAITDQNLYCLPYVDGKSKYTYVVTALDRLKNESKGKKKKVKL